MKDQIQNLQDCCGNRKDKPILNNLKSFTNALSEYWEIERKVWRTWDIRNPVGGVKETPMISLYTACIKYNVSPLYTCRVLSSPTVQCLKSFTNALSEYWEIERKVWRTWDIRNPVGGVKETPMISLYTACIKCNVSPLYTCRVLSGPTVQCKTLITIWPIRVKHGERLLYGLISTEWNSKILFLRARSVKV